MTKALSSNSAAILFCAVILILLSLLSSCSGGSAGINSDEQPPDPIIADSPIAYIKRPLPVDEDGLPVEFDSREPFQFNPGAILYLRDRASPSAAEQDISSSAFATSLMENTAEDENENESNDEADSSVPLYDVKDLAASYDGNKLVFVMRAPAIENADEDEQPTWNIWEYDIQTATITRLIKSDIIAEAGHDIAPHYLPDGRIVFSSTRQRTSKAILLDEGKTQFAALNESGDEPAALLHVMDGDGENIEQISFNQSHDLNPTVLSNGKILFSRWDNIMGRNEMNFYSVNPDGSDLTIMYGAHSHNTGTDDTAVQFADATPLPNGNILSILRDYTTEVYGSDLIAIDIDNYTDNDQPTWDNQGLLTSAQSSLSLGTVTTDGSPSPQGRFNSAAPLFDNTNRLLVSWSLCQLTNAANDNSLVTACDPNSVDENLEEAESVYGIWIYDLTDNTQLPIVVGEPGFMYGEVVALQARDFPTVITDLVDSNDANQSLIDQGVGVLHIRSVYDFDGVDLAEPDISSLADPALTVADERPARFLRIVKPVSMADEDIIDVDGTAFGRSQRQGMREIIGYAPIQPDGSVKIKIPANVAFNVSILDSEGKRISSLHQNWLQLRPGEEKECVGCHTDNSSSPHGRPDAQAPSINIGAAMTDTPFPNTVASLLPQSGETMAETITRINGTPTPAFDLEFTDEWTDINVRAADPSISLRYTDLSTESPVNSSCVSEWNARCLIKIHYPTHIAPIWEVDRRIFDTDEITLLSDNTCTSCHNTEDANDQLQVPVAQLDLTNQPSIEEPDHYTSYRELLFGDQEQEIVNGVLIDRLVPVTDGQGNIVFERDENGNLILDADNNPIPQTTTVTINAILNVNGAANNDDFFALFATGGSHENYLSAAELKLLAEWLDIGAQYYNDPFAVPQN